MINSWTILVKFIPILFIGCAQKINVQEQDISAHEIKWEQSELGGGGFITGITQNTKNPNIIYIRCDVGGVFKSTDRGKSWEIANKGVSKGYHHNVEAIAISPHNPNILLRGSGEARGHKLVGDIHKSVDGGESWYQVTDKVDFYGNGLNRVYGENIDFDPFDSTKAIAAGYKNGIYLSEDQGESWIYTGLKGEPIATIAYHPYSKNIVYAGTLRTLRMEEYLYPNGGYNREQVGRLYQSTNGGNSWELVYESDSIEFGGFAFTKTNKNFLMVAGTEYGLFASHDGGKSFSKAMNGLPKKMAYNSIANNHHKPEQFLVAPKREGRHADVPLVPLYVSNDFGENWKLLNAYTREDFTEYPSYIKTEEWIGWSISRFIVDEADPSRLYMSNWYGVSVSEDTGATWCGNYFEGTETTCAENVVVHSAIPGTVFFTLPDHRPFISTNYGRSYKQFATRTEYNNSTALVASVENPDLIIYGGKQEWDGTGGSAILRSTDNGETFAIVKVFPEDLTIQALKEDPHAPGTFYAYLDRSLKIGAGLYKSDDWGLTWKQLNLELPGHIKSLPHYGNWIENELLSVTYGQRKNVCGTNQLLALDPHKPNTIYFGEWTEGLFKTEDGGKNWKDISQGLPYKNDTTTALVALLADEQNPGWVYAGFIHDGLWRSKDYGQTWSKIYPLETKIFNASSITLGGNTNEQIYIASEPLYWSPSESAIMYSPDNGQTWSNIYDNRYGALRWKSIDLDADGKVLYGVTVGNGAFYADVNNLKSKN